MGHSAHLQDIDAPAGQAGERQAATAGDHTLEEFQRQPVLLIPDGALQQLPWESLPGLRAQPCVLSFYSAPVMPATACNYPLHQFLQLEILMVRVVI